MSKQHFGSCVDSARRQDQLNSWCHAVLWADKRIAELEKALTAIKDNTALVAGTALGKFDD